jgi:hypothetical protein
LAEALIAQHALEFANSVEIWVAEENRSCFKRSTRSANLTIEMVWMKESFHCISDVYAVPN